SHHSAAMNFYCLFGRAKFSRDLFVQHASCDQLHHFKLARCQRIEKTPGLIPFGCKASLLSRPNQCALYTLKQLISSERFGEKIDRTRFHRLSAHGDVAMAGDKDELLFSAVLYERCLKIHPVHFRHSYIDDHACGPWVLFTREKIGCRFKNLAFVSCRPHAYSET